MEMERELELRLAMIKILQTVMVVHQLALLNQIIFELEELLPQKIHEQHALQDLVQILARQFAKQSEETVLELDQKDETIIILVEEMVVVHHAQ